ncbi:hypothetical protein [Rhodophyticola porphyridii]|uniref:hypothetical protein n=1 Tax=Rhodophyticola porphyridii TaxID=1852017 RepID=UPI001B0724FB|nr:hypothetical protein [Roseicyclus sp.]
MTARTYKELMEGSSTVLTLKIDNSQPIRLADFVHAFTSLAEEYRQTVSDSNDFVASEAEIYVKEVRTGSIVADLIPVVASVVPLVAAEVDRVILAVEVVERWRQRLTSLVQGVIPDGASRSDLRRWANAVEAIARDPDASSTLEAATFEDGKREVRASFTFKSSEARQIENVIEGEFQRLDTKKQADHERVLMVFTRSDVGDAPVGKRSGERVLISEVSDKPLAISYGSELAEQRIKHEIRESDDNIFKKGFNVDVKVQLVGGRPAVYSIVNVHDIIDLPE